MEAQTATRGSNRSKVRRHPGAIIAVVLGVLALVVGLQVLEHADHPGFVDRMTVANATQYPVDIEIKAAGDQSWLGLGTVDSRSRQEFHQVVDQGHDWVIRLTANGGAAVSLPMSRTALAEADWRIDVTPQIGAQLREAGAIPFS